MICVRGKSIKDIIEKISEMDENEDEKEIYINTELTKDLAILIIEKFDVNKIYLPESRYKRTNKKLIKLLKEVADVSVEKYNMGVGRPSKYKEKIRENLDKTPEEISKKTGINKKTVEYHYYKLKKQDNGK